MFRYNKSTLKIIQNVQTFNSRINNKSSLTKKRNQFSTGWTHIFVVGKVCLARDT